MDSLSIHLFSSKSDFYLFVASDSIVNTIVKVKHIYWLTVDLKCLFKAIYINI